MDEDRKTCMAIARRREEVLIELRQGLLLVEEAANDLGVNRKDLVKLSDCYRLQGLTGLLP